MPADTAEFMCAIDSGDVCFLMEYLDRYPGAMQEMLSWDNSSLPKKSLKAATPA